MTKRWVIAIEEFCLKNKLLVFSGILVLTIALTRIITLINDPHIIIRGFELHHFFYGTILLIVANLALLFGKRHLITYLIFSAIAIGLITDQMLFILGKMSNDNYVSTWPSAIIFTLLIIVITLLLRDPLRKEIFEGKMIKRIEKKIVDATPNQIKPQNKK